MIGLAEQPVVDFYCYPWVGDDDWRYTFATAQVRVLMSQMLSRAVMLDMANADSFEQCVDLLASSEYALPQGGKNFSDAEDILFQRRTQAAEISHGLMQKSLRHWQAMAIH